MKKFEIWTEDLKNKFVELQKIFRKAQTIIESVIEAAKKARDLHLSEKD